MENPIYTLNEAIKQSKNIVFIGGAGVSTASGIPDFRGKNGLYTTSKLANPEQMLSYKCFRERPEDFFKWYREHMTISGAKPNIVHYKLAEMEKTGKLKAVITQNIDGLHQEAGSKSVIELHGNARKAYCTDCYKPADIEDINTGTGVPKCKFCGEVIRPAVTLYGESLDMQDLRYAKDFVLDADMLIVAGTSLRVFPACELPNYFTGRFFAIINLTPTPFDKQANILIHDDLSSVFEQIKV